MRHFFKTAVTSVFVTLTVGLSGAQATSGQIPMRMPQRHGTEMHSHENEGMHKSGSRHFKGFVYSKTKSTGNRFGFVTPYTKGRHRIPRTIGNSFKSQGNYPEMKGAVVWSANWSKETENTKGLYTIPFSATQDFNCLFETDGTFNAVYNEGIYYTTDFFSFWGDISMTVNAYDATSGELLYSFVPKELDAVPMALAVDPLTDKIYGIFSNKEGDGFEFGTISYFENSYERTTISNLDINHNWCALAADNTGQFYAISRNIDTDENGNSTILESVLWKINRDNGALTKIGPTGQYPSYISGATIDLDTNRMFWTVNPADDTGWICEVDLSTGAADKIYEFPGDEEVIGIYVPRAEASPKAPASLKDFNIDFREGTLKGKADISAPSTLFDGTQASGEVEVVVEINNKVVATTSCEYGAQVSVPLEVPEGGMYAFKAYARNSEGRGPKSHIRKYWVGTDYPRIPVVNAVWKDGTMTVSWQPVTESVNGGYIDASKVRYNLKCNGDQLADGLAETIYSYAVAEPEEIGSYQYELVAVYDGKESGIGFSNTIVLGLLTLPYNPGFENDLALQGWTIIDSNNDGVTWRLSGDGSLAVSYNSDDHKMAMDDWALTPPFPVEAGKIYEVSFYASGEDYAYPERLEVKYGTDNSSEAMTEMLLEPTVIDGGEDGYMAFRRYIKAEHNGRLFLGFHGISDPYMSSLHFWNLRIENGAAPEAPDVVKDLVVTPDSDGAHKATVSFTTPSKNIGGENLGSISRIEILRDGEVIKTYDSPDVNTQITYEDMLPSGGYKMYSVIVHNPEGSSAPVYAKAFVGVTFVPAPENVNIMATENIGEIVLTWDKITEDFNGKPIDPSKVKYNVYKTTFDGSEKIASEIEETSFTYKAVEDGKQDFIQCFVMGITDAGQGDSAYSDMLAVGTPYDGWHETGNFETKIGRSSAGGASWDLITYYHFNIMGQDDDLYFGCLGEDPGDYGELLSGLVSLDRIENPGITFYAYNLVDGDADNTNKVSVSVQEIGSSEWIKVFDKTVKDICGGFPDIWGKATVNLADFAGKTIQVKFTATTESYDYPYTFIDNMKVGTILNHDLAATAIVSPEKVRCGESYSVDVHLANDGVNDADKFFVELYADNSLIETREGSMLRCGESVSVGFQQQMSAIATAPIEYYAVVKYDADEDVENNRSVGISVTPKQSALPAPRNLQAENVSKGVKLTWEDPDLNDLPGTPVTHDFEDATPFAAEYSDWTFIDVDKNPVGGFEGITIPGIQPEVTNGSFWIWDHASDGVDGNLANSFKAHGGDKYMFALFRADYGATDDWAVSPKLNGKPQEISLWAKSFDSQYPEKIGIYYSTGSLDPEDFIKIENAGDNAVPGVWTLYTAELPAGAVYFAIRSYAEDAFMLMVDDVAFVPAGSKSVDNVELKGFDIYRNGVKLNDDVIGDYVYIDYKVEENKDYEYLAVAKYNIGTSAVSNKVNIKTSGIENVHGNNLIAYADNGRIIINNPNGQEVSVYSLDGVLVYRGFPKSKTAIDVNPGVYIVKVGVEIIKLVVR